MTKKRFTKNERQKIYQKYGGRCAYCGKPIYLKDMQVDHLIPQFLKGSAAHQYLAEQIESFENYMPSCRRCNHYKRGNNIETFREWIRTIPSKLMRDNYIFKVGCDYGMWNSQNPPSIKFYFETQKHLSKESVDFLNINFSPKQDEILMWWLEDTPTYTHNGIIVDGSVHSGKSFVTGLSFLMWAMKNFENKTFLIAGKSASSVMREIILPLEPFLKIDFNIEKWQLSGKVNSNTRYTLINKKTKVKNTFYILGNRDVGSEIIMQDLTLSGVLFDEPVLMNRAFVNQSIARCSGYNAKLWFVCTPENPFNWFYKEWICKRNEKMLLYTTLTLDDNLGMSEKTKKRYKSLYSGVFYRRMIDGKWCVAEGLVYPMFNNENIVDCDLDVLMTYMDKFYISVDYGTVNPFTAALWGVSGNVLFRLKEFYHNSRETGMQFTDEEYYQHIKELANGVKIEKMIVDASAASFIETVRRHREFELVKSSSDILQDIGTTAELITTGNLVVHKDCTHLISEIATYKWSGQQDMPERANDHCCDDMRYFVGYYKTLKV